MEIHNNVKLLEVNLDIECSIKHGQHVNLSGKEQIRNFLNTKQLQLNSVITKLMGPKNLCRYNQVSLQPRVYSKNEGKTYIINTAFITEFHISLNF